MKYLKSYHIEYEMNLHSRTEIKIENLSPLVRILLRLEKVQLTVYFIER